jgi:hypothetical protein
MEHKLYEVTNFTFLRLDPEILCDWPERKAEMVAAAHSADTQATLDKPQPKAPATCKLRFSGHYRTKSICLPGSFSTQICGRLIPKFRYHFNKGSVP